MGESKRPFVEPSFNRSVKERAGDDRLTSDAGSLLLRQADDRLGLAAALASPLYDRRQPDRIRYQMVELLRERLDARAQGHGAQHDGDELAHDPALRLAAWDQPGEQVEEERLASPRSRGCWRRWGIARPIPEFTFRTYWDVISSLRAGVVAGAGRMKRW